MGEVINIFIGQWGSNVGLELLSYLAKEHNFDGKRSPSILPSVEYKSAFFREDSKGEYQARAIFVDYIQNSSTDPLSNFDSIVNKLLDTNNIVRHGTTNGLFTHMYHEESGYLLEMFSECLRNEKEKADKMIGFQLFYHSSGGAGSALGSLVSGELIDKLVIGHIGMPQFPNDNPKAIINSTMNFSALQGNFELANLVDDNNAFELWKKEYQLECKSVYSLIGKMAAEFTCGQRSNGRRNYRLNNIAELIFPKLHFFTITLGQNGNFQSLDYPENSLGFLDISNGTYLTSANVFRGDYSTFEVENYFRKPSADTTTLQNKWFCKANFFSNYFVNLDNEYSKPSCFRITNHTSSMTYRRYIIEAAQNILNNRVFQESFKNDTVDEDEVAESFEKVNYILDEYQQYAEVEKDNESSIEN